MTVTESELFDGDEVDSIRLERGEDKDMTISYSVDDERRESPKLSALISLNLKRSERNGLYIVTSSAHELRAGSLNPLRAIAELLDHVRETYNYTKYYYEVYSNDDEVEQLRVMQNDSIVFRIGELDDNKEYDIESREFSYDFWESLYRTEYKSSRYIEKIDQRMISTESLRIPVKENMDELEKEIVVQINKYLVEFYKDNNVLSEDVPLHNLIGFAAIMSGHNLDTSTLTVYFEEAEED